MPEGLLSAIHPVLQTREAGIARLNATYPQALRAATNSTIRRYGGKCRPVAGHQRGRPADLRRAGFARGRAGRHRRGDRADGRALRLLLLQRAQRSRRVVHAVHHFGGSERRLLEVPDAAEYGSVRADVQGNRRRPQPRHRRRLDDDRGRHEPLDVRHAQGLRTAKRRCPAHRRVPLRCARLQRGRRNRRAGWRG